jgi:hypothetical protein
LIPGESRAKFCANAPEKDYRVCITGKIEDYRGKPEIVVTDPQQIQPQSKQRARVGWGRAGQDVSLTRNSCGR